MVLPLLVFLPVAAALAAYPLARRSMRIGNGIIISVSALCLALALSLLAAPDLRFAWDGFCGLGIRFAAGSFRTVLAVIAAFMWLATALASPEYFAHGARNARYYFFFLFTLGALLGVFLAGDFFTLFIFFEIMSFTSYVWVAQNETKEALRASETYLYIAVIGGLVMLMGLFLLYSKAGTLSPEGLASAELADSLRFAAAVCMLFGFGAKAGMFPLHIWLPKAHPVAPAPASALLSGILTKSGVFGIIGVTCWLMAGVEKWGELLLLLAVITMVLGAVLAVFSVDLKRTLACSSMSQIGFILVGVAMRCLLGEEGGLAAYGSVLHMLNHSLIKLTLFVAAGVVYCNVHSLDLNDVRGFGRGKPWLMLCFLSGACSIAGIPGFGGYVSKTLLHESIVEYAEHVAAHGGNVLPYTAAEWLFLISGGLTFAYMARLFYILFLAKPSAKLHEKPGGYMGKPTAAVLAVGGVLMPLLGLTAHSSMERIAGYAAPFLRSEGPAHAVQYFVWANLKGAAISITVGCLVFLLAGWLWLTRRDGGEEQYRNVWPRRLDLEDSLYRPLLKALCFLGALIARFIESIGTWLIYGALNLIYYRADSKVHPDENIYFGRYGRKKRAMIAGETFSSDLILALLGILATVLYLLIRI